MPLLPDIFVDVADIIFIGVDGINGKKGLTCTNPSEAEVLRKLVHNAKMKVVVADHSKLGCVSKYFLFPTEETDRLITDTGASASAIAPFERLGIDVARA